MTMNKKLSIVGLVLIALCTMAATIQWYSQQPAITTLEDSMVLAVERAVPQGYRSITLASLRSYTGTNTLIVSSNVYTTNLYTTNLYTSNLFATNIFSTNIYTTNLYTSNLFTTNLYSTNAYITNLTVNNLYALTSSISSLVVTNGISLIEHAWEGPTNQLTLSTNEYYYITYTPCAVTNLAIWMGAGYAESALLSITNASSSNITFTVHSPIRIPYGETSRSYTLTNGDVFFGSFRKGAHGSAFVPRGFWQP